MTNDLFRKVVTFGHSHQQTGDWALLGLLLIRK